MINLNKIDVIYNAIEYAGFECADYEVFYKSNKDAWYKLDLTMNSYDRYTTKEFIEHLLECWFNKDMIANLRDGASNEDDFRDMLKDFYKHVTLLELILNDK